MGRSRTGGRRRLSLASGLALLCWIAAVGPALAATFDVNETIDVPDPNPGDSVCDVDPGTAGNQCSLRAAVQQANALPSTAQNPHLINLPAQTFTLTIPGRDELAGATGDLNLTATGIRIVGQGATQSPRSGATSTASTSGCWTSADSRSSSCAGPRPAIATSCSTRAAGSSPPGRPARQPS